MDVEAKVWANKKRMLEESKYKKTRKLFYTFLNSLE